METKEGIDRSAERVGKVEVKEDRTERWKRSYRSNRGENKKEKNRRRIISEDMNQRKE